MNKNILDFYIKANNLKNVIRTGWKEVGIPSDKVESVADHVYGTMVLSLGIIEEKKLDLDISKIFKMIILKELSKAVTNREESVIASTKEEVYEYCKNIIESLNNSEDLLSVFEEYESKSSEEAKFVYKVSKLESDIQAKIYEKNGDFTIENALEDIKNYPEEIKNKLENIENASDGWLAFDRQYYDDELFKELQDEIRNI